MMASSRLPRRRLVVGGAALMTLLAIRGADAQGSSYPEPRAFRVQWEQRADQWRRPAIEGYVYNDSNFRVGNVRLRVELLDQANQVIGERLVWAYGNIPAGNRLYFLISPPPKGAHAYRIEVESFDLVARETRESP